jgi:hypothetical protein
MWSVGSLLGLAAARQTTAQAREPVRARVPVQAAGAAGGV